MNKQQMSKTNNRLPLLRTTQTITQTHSRYGFTIIELTIVIGVLSILLAIALPTVKSVRMAAERKKAEIQATLLTQAVLKYKDVYGFWPGQLEVTSSGGGTPQVQLSADFKNKTSSPVIISRFNNTDFEVQSSGDEPIYLGEGGQRQNQLYQALNIIDPENQKSDGLYQPNPLNPRQIKFVDLENITDIDEIGFPDPWGQEFIVFMGLNPRNRFTYEQRQPSYRITVSNCTAFAFSRGPDGDRSGKFIMAAGVNYDEE
jgi:prepilin-type N-terminal cleavage/methylation domain-containing protein